MNLNVGRFVLATLGAFVAYFAFGGVVFALIKPLSAEFRKYPAVYRSQDSIMKVFPVGMIAMLVAIAVLTILYAMIYRGGSGLVEGTRFGALIGVFVIGAFVVHNYVNLNVGVVLTVQSAIAYFLEWLVVGIVIGLIYRP
jgi:hypothetical protein